MTRKRVSAVLTLLLLGVGWFFLAPAAVGGETNYVITHGDSMLPRFHTGDLAIVTPAAHYQVGEVVAYRSTLLHTIVLHRIVGRHGSAYTLKGDHNTWLDPEHPKAGQLVGRLWLRVPHGGAVLQWLHRPAVAAGLAIAAVLATAGTSTARRRRRRRSGRPEGRPAMPRNPFLNSPVVGGLAAASVAAAGLAAFAVTRPSTEAATARVPFTQQVAVTYDGTTTSSSLYPDRRLRDGDPIFRRLVRTVRIQAGYRFAAAAAYTVAGTVELTATVASPTGWQQTLALSHPQPFTGDHATVSAPLNLRELDGVVGRIGSATGLPTTSYTLTVDAVVHSHGAVSGKTLGDVDVTTPLTFAVDALRAQPQAVAGDTAAATTSPAGTAGSTGPGTVGTKTFTGSVAVATTRPATWTLLGRRVTVSTARDIAIALTVLFLLALLVAIRRSPRSDHEADRINAAYRGRLVSISGQDGASQRAVLDVTSIEALARIADRYDRLLLHRREGEIDTYLVDDEGILYRYQVRASRAGGTRRGGRRRLA